MPLPNDVRCPKCGAEPKKPCMTKRGQEYVPGNYHAARYDAANPAMARGPK